MTSRQFAVLALLAVIWGASLLLLRVAAPELGPFPFTIAPVLIAVIAFAAISEIRKNSPIVRRPQTAFATEWRVWIGPRAPIENEVVSIVPLSENEQRPGDTEAKTLVTALGRATSQRPERSTAA